MSGQTDCVRGNSQIHFENLTCEQDETFVGKTLRMTADFAICVVPWPVSSPRRIIFGDDLLYDFRHVGVHGDISAQVDVVLLVRIDGDVELLGPRVSTHDTTQ